MVTKCPACGRATSHVFRCDHCGDIRCSLARCPGTNGGRIATPGQNSPCKACNKGKYKRL